MTVLTAEAAAICMHECGGQCCRGPQYLRLLPDEIGPFSGHATKLGVSLHLVRVADGGAVVRYLEHDGERCPMLDPSTCACRIYAERPTRCREFPDGPRPGCAISTATRT